jgi:hypothetical protein
MPIKAPAASGTPIKPKVWRYGARRVRNPATSERIPTYTLPALGDCYRETGGTAGGLNLSAPRSITHDGETMCS